MRIRWGGVQLWCHGFVSRAQYGSSWSVWPRKDAALASWGTRASSKREARLAAMARVM